MKVVLSKMNLQVSVFHIRLYAFRFEENIVLVNGRISFRFRWWATLYIFHEPAACHYWDMHVNLCIKFHGFLHHESSAFKNEFAGLSFSYQTICFQIWGKHSTSKWPLFFRLCWCATLDIFHGPAACHFWDMHVNFCIKFHFFLHHESSAFKKIIRRSQLFISDYMLSNLRKTKY